MVDLTASLAGRVRIDRVWLLVLALPLLVSLIDPLQAKETVRFAIGAFSQTGMFILFAVLAVGLLKATGAEALLAKAFEGREVRMIVLAALLGGLSPFCSCEVIPFIAALLAVGAPLSAVMAFWLSSPLMDPAMFLITAGTLGMPFAVAKTVSAVGMGLLGGMIVRLLFRSPVFADPLRPQPQDKGCGCGPSPFKGTPEWRFWRERQRREVFRGTVIENALFLGKWLMLADMIEA
ncbi:MAG: permease, partial [Boseongicola sp. SB0676_bin_33]|nr:permease [Boseongicola sp. SB0676_bin_33]